DLPVILDIEGHFVSAITTVELRQSPCSRIDGCLSLKERPEFGAEELICLIPEESIRQQFLYAVWQEETVLGCLERRSVKGSTVLSAGSEAVNTPDER